MVRLRVLGPFELTDSRGKPISAVIAQPKRCALLAYLALARPAGPQRRDSLLALFWPDSTEERARHSLNQALSALRRDLPGVVATRGLEEVELDRSAIECDASQFEDLLREQRQSEGLAVYRGDLLPGFHLSDVPEFERWLDAERSRLRDAAVDAAMSLTQAALAGNDGASARDWASRASSLAPDDERVLRTRLEVLDKTGDRAGAVRLYDEFAHRLRAEYQVDPSPETRAVIEQIRSRQLANQATNEPAAPRRRSEPSLASQTSTIRRPTVARSLTWAIIGTLGVIVLTALVSRRTRIPSSSTTGIQPATIGSRIVVIPFENKSGDSTLVVLGSVASDWVTQGLVETRLLNVVEGPLGAPAPKNGETAGPQSVSQLRPSQSETSETEPRLAITGSIIRKGDSLALQARVVDLHTGELLAATRPVWAPRSNPVQSVRSIRDLIIGALAERLDERISSQAPALLSEQPPKIAAYEEYLMGLDAFFAGAYHPSAAHFARAVAEDSTFTLPLIWSVFAYGNAGDDTGRTLALERLRRRANDLSPADRIGAEYLAARGNAANQLALSRSAAALAPQSVWAWNHALAAMRMNQPVEALAALRGLDPEHGWLKGWKSNYYGEIAVVLHVLGDYNGEIEAARKAPAGGHRWGELRGLIGAGRFGEVRAQLPSIFGDEHVNGLLTCVLTELRMHGFALTPQDESSFAEAARREASGTDSRSREFVLRVLYEARQWAASARGADEYLKENPRSVEITGLKGVIAVRQGNRALADRIYAALDTMTDETKDFPNTIYWQTRIASVRGDSATALADLQRAYARGMIRLFGYGDPACTSDFDALRHYSAFRALAAEGLR